MNYKHKVFQYVVSILDKITDLITRFFPESRPSWDDYFMSLACVISSRSLDNSTKHGSVLVNNHNEILSTGYNSYPKGGDHAIYPTERPEKYDVTIHSELNAMLFCKSNTDGATLYVTGLPCSKCMLGIVQKNIKRVVYGSVKSSCVEGVGNDKSTWLVAKNHNIELVEYKGNHPILILLKTILYLSNKWR